MNRANVDKFSSWLARPAELELEEGRLYACQKKTLHRTTSKE
jgi:hypothetical protein